MAEKIVLGTRGSQLARAQARLVGEAIQAARPELKIDTKIVVTKGDQPGRLHIGDSPRGRKGLFTADIERALLAEDVDVAVHSAKDLPSETSPGVDIAAVLQRAPIDDVLVLTSSAGFAVLPNDEPIAMGGVRGIEQLSWARQDIELVDLLGD